MPDVGMAAHLIERRKRIISACEKCWPLEGPNGLLNKADCSGFVNSVAAELGIDLRGTANEIFQAISRPPWVQIGTGDAAAHHAAVAAAGGMFVVGAWRNPTGPVGHVAVIVDTNYSSPAAPHRLRAIAYWGTLGAEGEMYKPHSRSWGASKRPQVLYAGREIRVP